MCACADLLPLDFLASFLDLVSPVSRPLLGLWVWVNPRFVASIQNSSLFFIQLDRSGSASPTPHTINLNIGTGAGNRRVRLLAYRPDFLSAFYLLLIRHLLIIIITIILLGTIHYTTLKFIFLILFECPRGSSNLFYYFLALGGYFTLYFSLSSWRSFCPSAPNTLQSPPSRWLFIFSPFFGLFIRFRTSFFPYRYTTSKSLVSLKT